MVTLVFAVLTVFGSWYAWRRNPMYSRRRTLHFLLATGLSIAAVIGIIFAVVNLTQGQSETIQLTAILSTAFFCAIALIWIIVTVTTPRLSAIPAGMKLATLHRRRLIPWIKRMCWSLAILGLVALIPAPHGAFNWPRFFALFLGAWVLGLGGILLAAGYIGGRNLDRSLTAVLANPWVHWSYASAEWSSFIVSRLARAESERKQLAGEKKVNNWIVLLAIGLPVTVGMYFAGFQPLWIDPAVGFATSGLLVGIGELARRKTGEATDRLRRKLVAASPQAYLGPDGLFANGSYQPWLSTGVYLIRASLDARQPSTLLFEFEVIAAGRTATPSHISEAVLLPSAFNVTELDAQLAMLQRELNSVARAAIVHIA